jgi:hypothetical protein
VRHWGVAPKAAKEGDEGPTLPYEHVAEGETPEQQMIAREGPDAVESEYDRRAREYRAKQAHQEMIASQPARARLPAGKRQVGTKAPEGTYAKEKLTEEQKPVTRELSPEEKAARIAELEAQYGTTITTNRRNRPEDGPPPETAGEHHAEIASAREALQTDDPVHPLISDPEPHTASLDRAKGILERGEAGDVSDFITPEFLDKLAKVNDGVEVVHAPVEVVSGEKREGQAFYQPNKDRIVLSNNVSSADYARTSCTSTHAATEHLMNNDPVFRGEVDDLRQRSRPCHKGSITNERLLYGLHDPHEFLSEANRTPSSVRCCSVSAPGRGVIQGAKNVLNALYRSVRR